MKITLIFIHILFYSIQSYGNECFNPQFKNQKYWFQKISTKIDDRVQYRKKQKPKLDLNVIKNLEITKSYTEFFQAQESRSEFTQLFGYVYANASHHLGRLVRYHHWPSKSELGKKDKELIEGSLLKLANNISPKYLSKRLMFHSFSLYKYLAWSIEAAKTCGDEYVVDIASDPNLKAAFQAKDTKQFLNHFVTYEQSFLQETLFSEFLIKLVSQNGILDKMRTITFNGQDNTNFKQWCKVSKCKTTSYNLKNRIKFDLFIIFKELNYTMTNFDVLRDRLESTDMEQVYLFFNK